MHHPTCKFLDPSAAEAERDGLISGSDYPYDKHLPFSSCWSKDRAVNGDPETNWISCECPGNWTSCDFFVPEEAVKLRVIRIQDKDLYRYFVLDRVRLDGGVAELRIITWSNESDSAFVIPETAEIIYTINSHANRENFDTVAHEFFSNQIDVLKNEDESNVYEAPIAIAADEATSYVELVLQGGKALEVKEETKVEELVQQ